jgi:serine/threonine protein kinase
VGPSVGLAVTHRDQLLGGLHPIRVQVQSVAEFPLTIFHMSPAQADLSGLDVDTRGDVYLLGVLLYELLTGSTPLDRSTLRSAAYAQILRRIKEEEPPKPSMRIRSRLWPIWPRHTKGQANATSRSRCTNRR